MENNLIIIALLFYFIGSISFAYILPKILGFGDIRNIGSGNVGATNVLRTGNKKLAFLVLLLDILKGYLPLLVLKNNFLPTINEEIIYLVGSLTIIGHIFPIWLKFKGGKGVATYIGYIFAVNYLLGLLFIFSWLIIAGIKRYSSLASILSLIILPIITILLSYENFSIYIFSLISLIVIAKHYFNILRLLNKTEDKIRF